MKKCKSKLLMLSALSASMLALNASAGTMGGISDPTLVLIEAGGSYSHVFYKDSVISPESVTVFTPGGVAYEPDAFYPDDFGGGYFGLSIFKNYWMMNMRYDMYASSTTSNPFAGTMVKLAPAKLTFSADKVWGDINTLTYGLGIGATVSTINKGSALLDAPVVVGTTVIDFVQGETISGRTRIDPIVEAFGMYHIGGNVNLKLNVAYQIPVNSMLTDGNLNTNLGVNIALPI